MDNKLDEYLGHIDEGRREILRKLILGAAFVAPVATTFGLGPANAQVPNCLLSNEGGFAEGPGTSGFGYTQNRDNCSATDFPEGFGKGQTSQRFPRLDETLDKHGK